MEINIIGKRIKLLREELGLNQIELAEKLSLSSSASVSQYESGDRTPSDDIKIKLAELFNVSIDYLLGKTDIKKPTETDILDEAFIGLSRDKIDSLTEEQKNKIRSFVNFVLEEENK